MKMKYYLCFLLVISSVIAAQQNKTQATKIEVKDAWIRTSAEGSNSALFFEVVNNSDYPDTLLSAESNLAEVVEVHETFKRENDMMGMRKVNFVVIPPKSTVKFKPRDLHVMLIKLKKDLRQNEKGDATLLFKIAGKIKVNAIVRDMQMMMNK
ncbi:MAG: copper chaperone PCu(A)C [Ignavibacteria bacterium]|nr:copper chaperone PCu(A)C [Ignavibacteria bacterium]